MRFRELMVAAGLAASAVLAAAPAQAAPVIPARNADGRALILVPLSLTKIDDLSFGTVIPSGVSGVVAIDAASGARTIAGGVTGVSSDVGHRARFAGGGSPNQMVIVTLVPPTQLTSVAGDTIPVLAVTVEGGPIHLIDPVSRVFYFGVGGVIVINANQAEGVYQANFTVTANYQ